MELDRDSTTFYFETANGIPLGLKTKELLSAHLYFIESIVFERIVLSRECIHYSEEHLHTFT